MAGAEPPFLRPVPASARFSAAVLSQLCLRHGESSMSRRTGRAEPSNHLVILVAFSTRCESNTFERRTAFANMTHRMNTDATKCKSNWSPSLARKHLRQSDLRLKNTAEKKKATEALLKLKRTMTNQYAQAKMIAKSENHHAIDIANAEFLSRVEFRDRRIAPHACRPHSSVILLWGFGGAPQ